MMSTQQAELDASLLTIIKTINPRPLPAATDPTVRLLAHPTDHKITATWSHTNGWSAPTLQAYAPLPLAPAASALHYATQCFEGLKLFRSGHDGKLRLFRPGMNCERMRRSAERVALPDFDPRELEELIVELCKVEASKWLPKSEGEGALYVRPMLIGTDPALATIRPRSATLCIFLTVFPNIPKISAALASKNPGEEASLLPQKRSTKLLASDNAAVRAWPGGFGDSKVGANYGPALVLQDQAKAEGFDQILWLFGEEEYVTEAGASNFFVVLKGEDEGTWELTTAPLEEGLVLPGVMRDSVLQLARERLQVVGEEGVRVEVVERKFTMGQVVEAYEQGRVVEAFVTGTALFITSVGVIRSQGRDLEITCESVGGVMCSQMLREWLSGIMNGKEEHEWARIVNEE